MNNAYLTEVLSKIEAISKKAKAEFEPLNATQLNWKPHPAKWSIGQCLDHLIATNRSYYPQLKVVASGEKRSTFWEKMPLLPGVFGKMLLKTVAPRNAKPVKTFAVFEPTSSDIASDIVQQFMTHQKEWGQLLRQTDQADHQQTILTSPVSRIMTYTLHDCITMLAMHEERHFNQAKRVMTQSTFPGA